MKNDEVRAPKSSGQTWPPANPLTMKVLAGEQIAKFLFPPWPDGERALAILFDTFSETPDQET